MSNNLPTDSDIARRHLVISGKVQGVSYRVSMAKAAEQRGVRGWVRNLPDRTVEAFLIGDSESVASLIHWARRGPAAAVVSHVAVELVEDDDDGGDLENFSVIG